MSKIIFIGTLHAGLTPHEELRQVLEQYEPERILLEIVQSDIQKGTLDKYPDEMIFALAWAHKNYIEVQGIDSPIDVLASGKTDDDNKLVIAEQKEILNKYSWKDANTREVNEKLNTGQVKTLIDPIKNQLRERDMLKNLQRVIDNDKKTIVLIGAGHLSFFQRHFPDALFPFCKLEDI